MTPLVGTAHLTQDRMSLGEEFSIPVLPAPGFPPSNASRLVVQIELIPGVSVVSCANRGGLIPRNAVLYANLAFKPGYPVSFPLAHSACPIDLEAVAISSTGEIANAVSVSEPGDTPELRHSGVNLTYCYDTYGPSIRADLLELFSDTSAPAAIFFVVSSNDPLISLSHFQWIAVDIYVSAEKSCHNLDGMIMMTDSKMSIPLFHSRISPSINSGAALTVVCQMTCLPSGISIRPIQWSAPSALFPLPVLSAIEIESELSTMLGFMPRPRFRRILCPPGRCCSLNRGLAINKFRSLAPVTLRCDWTESIDLDLSCIILDVEFSLSGLVFFNRLKDFGSGIIHAGDKKPGCKIESINLDIPKLPDNAIYLCFCLTSRGDNLINAGLTTTSLGEVNFRASRTFMPQIR
jgi:hypothetical protein